jgi:hypothetical protein
MNLPSLSHLCRVFLLLLITAAMPAMAAGKGKGGGGAEHPDMHEALDALRRSKTSTEPMADLNAAYHRLKQGRPNKEGYRARAMNLVEQAMEKRKAKENVESAKLVDQAITVIEKAVAASPDRK